MYDYKEVEGRCQAIEAQIMALADKDSPSDTDRDKLMSLTGEMHALEDVAGKMRDAELEELRAQVAKGNAVTIGSGETAAEAEKRNYFSWLRTGQFMDTALSTSDANGGFIVPEPVHAELIEKIRKNDPVFGNATLFRMTGDTTLLLPYKAAHGVVANATETGARAEQTEPTFTSPSLVCYDYFSDQRATQTVLDSVDGMETMLLGWMYEDIQEQAGADAVAGNGSTKIKGLFAETSAYSSALSGTSDALNNTCFLACYFALPIKYRSNAVWLMSGATLAVVAAYAHPASATTLLATQGVDGNYSILGRRVLETDSAPAIGNGLYPVAFGDIAAAYAVGIHRSTSILRDPYTVAPYVRFYSLARMGGCAWDYQALRLICSDDA